MFRTKFGSWHNNCSSGVRTDFTLEMYMNSWNPTIPQDIVCNRVL